MRPGAMIETTEDGLCVQCGRNLMKKLPAPTPLGKAAEILEKKSEEAMRSADAWMQTDSRNMAMFANQAQTYKAIAKALRGEE